MFTTQALVGYAVGLPAFSATRIAAQTFYALGDMRTPVYVGLRCPSPPTSLLALALMWPLQHAGLALASSLSSYVNLVGLCWLLRRRRGLIGGRDIARLAGAHGGASAVLLVWCLWVAPLARGDRTPAVRIASVALASGRAHLRGAAAALRAPELSALRGLLRRRGQLLALRPEADDTLRHASRCDRAPRRDPAVANGRRRGVVVFAPRSYA